MLKLIYNQADISKEIQHYIQDTFEDSRCFNNLIHRQRVQEHTT